MLLMAGSAPAPEEFCARHPRSPNLLARIHALMELRRELGGLARTLRVPANGVLGGCRMVALLDEGGMGSVHVAEDEATNTLCALKVLKHPSARGEERLMREARLLQTLDHPNIARVQRMGFDQDRAFMVVELVRGVSLRELLRKKVERARLELPGLTHAPALPSLGARIPLCVDLAHQVALALEHAHDRGVIHRDIKPSNLMVTPENRIKLIDFGIAREMQDVQHLTSSGVFVGSQNYAAPEQLKGERLAIGPWTDTYALGATLWEMLTGKPAFAGVDESRRKDVVKPSKLNPAVPRWLDAVCLRALNPNRTRRFQHGGLMAAALVTPVA